MVFFSALIHRKTVDFGPGSGEGSFWASNGKIIAQGPVAIDVGTEPNSLIVNQVDFEVQEDEEGRRSLLIAAHVGKGWRKTHLEIAFGLVGPGGLIDRGTVDFSGDLCSGDVPVTAHRYILGDPRKYLNRPNALIKLEFSGSSAGDTPC